VKIVVVEPDSMVKDFIVDVLEFSVNREVKSFDNGLKALRYLNPSGNFDLVLAEAELPGLGGLELLKQIKKEWPDKISILMSSRVQDEKEAADMGLDAYLAKPVGVKDLFAIVENFVVKTDQETSHES
jgi:two-component system response regulator FlrC